MINTRRMLHGLALLALSQALPHDPIQTARADPAETSDHFGAAMTHGDFNGDGYQDLAIGVPHEDIGTVHDAGAVEVIYGGGSDFAGLGPPNRQLWHQDVAAVEGVAEPEDYFGSALAAGDFNCDGYDDLAIGVPYDNVGAVAEAGIVNVVYGSPSGLSATWVGDVVLQDPYLATQDHFGLAVAAPGNDLGSCDMLAVGVPGWGSDEGAIASFDATPSGLAAAEAYEGSQPGAKLGSALVAGDFDADGYEELVAGAPYFDTIIIFERHPSTLFWSVNEYLVGPNTRFGYSLASGDFDGDGYDDLASGMPISDVGSAVDAGAVDVMYGSSGGLQLAPGSQYWHQDVTSVDDFAEAGDVFGWSLAAGDLNNDGIDDLAIGVPGEKVGIVSAAGAVHVIYGSSYGLNATHYPDQLWHQDGADVEDIAESGDMFGWALTAGDFNTDGAADLAIGVMYEDVKLCLFGVTDAGAVNVLYGAYPSLSATYYPDQIWTQGCPLVTPPGGGRR